MGEEAISSLRRILPEDITVFLHEGKSLVTAHSGGEMMAQIPASTVISILLEVGVFAEDSASYTDSTWWMDDNTQVFGCLWLARHVENYTRFGT